MDYMIIDLDTGTVVGRNVVVVEAFDVDHMSSEQLIEYGKTYGTPVVSQE